MDTTPVAIIGAGPAGLMLSHLLHLAGIDSVVIESQSRHEVESVVRAGILEQATVNLMRQTGVGERLDREAEIDEGIEISIGGHYRRVDFSLHANNFVAVYPQHEVLIDLIAQRLADEGELWFNTTVTSIEGHHTDSPMVHYKQKDGTPSVIQARYVVGADGSKSLARRLITNDGAQRLKHEYPYAWLGLMVEAPQTNPELIYATHEEGFALISTRTPSTQRYYLQCSPNDEPDDWTNEHIWNQLHLRADSPKVKVTEGEITDKAVLRFRSAVTSSMQSGSLFIAGDAAHTVPPTGAKGLNLAISDIAVLAPGLIQAFSKSNDDLLKRYSSIALPRIWKAQHFSYWMSSMLHSTSSGNPAEDAFQTQRRLAELDQILTTESGRTLLATQYVGLDFPTFEV